MNWRFAVIPAFAVLSWALAAQSPPGTADPRIDATTTESFERTFAQVQEALPSNLHMKLDQAWLILMSDTVERLPAELPEDVALGSMMQALHGYSGSEMISAAEAVVRRMLKEEQQRIAKVTTADLPKPTDVRQTRSWTCDALVTTTIAHAQPSPAMAYEITPESLLKKEVPDRSDRIEAASLPGTDKLALEITGETMRLMTRASLERGNTSATELTVVLNDAEQIVAFAMPESIPTGSANSIVVNKKTGFGVWTRTRAAGIFADVPDSQTHYLRCK